MDHSVLGRALNQEASGDWSPPNIKNHSPFLESLCECRKGLPTASWVGGIHVRMTLLLVEQLLQKAEDLGASGSYGMLLSPAPVPAVWGT